jgi:putative glycosyltransferase (TIGR04348 family)
VSPPARHAKITRMSSLPFAPIVSPALADANNGNWRTAERWRGFLAPVADARVLPRWDGGPGAALIALHARRSAASIAAFHAAHPQRGLALVLTGTDLYRDIDVDESAQRSLQLATHLVLLQPEGLRHLPAHLHERTRVIFQSAPRRVASRAREPGTTLVAVGHLREEKDPLTLMRAAELLAGEPDLRIVHIGNALDARLGEAARETMRRCPHYRWLGAVPSDEARDWIARADALVHMSRLEGGANVVTEALRSQVPVLASAIDGNLGLLGADHPATFAAGDAAALAALVRRFVHEPGFADRVRAHSMQREPLFRPAAERAAVRRLWRDLLAHEGKRALPQSSALPTDTTTPP